MNDETAQENYRVTAGELRQFIERFERLEAEKKDLADQQKEVMAEAKARGYDTRVMRKLVTLRKRDAADPHDQSQTRQHHRRRGFRLHHSGRCRAKIRGAVGRRA